MANKDWQLFVFDWDGTLMDTTSLIMKGYQHASVELGFPKPSDELVLSTIGLNRSDSIGICCADCPPGRYAEFTKAYMDWYAKQESQLDLVPGFRKLLTNMHKDGRRLAIATGKSRAGVERVFKITGVGDLFEAVQTADTNFSKPNPMMLHSLADETGLETTDMVMIGDSVLDMQMASNAKADSVAMTYGASPADKLKQYASLGTADNVEELAKILNLTQYLE